MNEISNKAKFILGVKDMKDKLNKFKPEDKVVKKDGLLNVNDVNLEENRKKKVIRTYSNKDISTSTQFGTCKSLKNLDSLNTNVKKNVSRSLCHIDNNIRESPSQQSFFKKFNPKEQPIVRYQSKSSRYLPKITNLTESGISY